MCDISPRPPIEIQVYDRLHRELLDKLRIMHEGNMAIAAKMQSLREKIFSHMAELRNLNLQEKEKQINIKA